MPPPDRWECYSPLGKPIPGTPFIALKVPLKEELMRNIFEKDKFSPSILMETLKQQGHNLVGIIDLTFTRKYYNIEEFEKNSIKHWKIFTKGHDVPSENVFQNFAKAVKSVEGTGSLIGVHCTHGVNRTGYLICRYMIEELNMEPGEAIALFNEARGHNLERENYLEDLKQRVKGKSTYDPDYVDTECTDNIQKSKERWRNNRDDQPNWSRSEQGMSNSHYRPAQYWRTNQTDKFRDEPVYNDYERLESVYNGYERREQRYYDSSSHSRSHKWNSSKPYYRDNEQNMSRKWTNDRDYRSGHDYHSEELQWKRHDDRYTHRSWRKEDSDKHRANRSDHHYSESRELRRNTSREKTDREPMRKGDLDDTSVHPQHQHSEYSEHRRAKHKRKSEDETLDNGDTKEHKLEVSDIGEIKKSKGDFDYLEEDVLVKRGSDHDHHDLDCESSKTKLEGEIIGSSGHKHRISDCESSNTKLEREVVDSSDSDSSKTKLEGEITGSSDSSKPRLEGESIGSFDRSKTKLEEEVKGGSDHKQEISVLSSNNTILEEEIGSVSSKTKIDREIIGGSDSSKTKLEGEIIGSSDSSKPRLEGESIGSFDRSKTKLEEEVKGGSDHKQEISVLSSNNTILEEEIGSVSSKQKIEGEALGGSDHSHQVSDSKSSNNTILDGEVIDGFDFDHQVLNCESKSSEAHLEKILVL